MPDHGTFKTWHKLLFEFVVPIPYYAGNFRGENLKAYPCLYGLATVGGKIGVLPDAVPTLMRDLASTLVTSDKNLKLYLQGEPSIERQTLAKLAMIAFAIGEMIRIHPFINGNGRVSRLIANHLCHRYDLPLPFVNPSRRPPLADYVLAGSASMDGNHRPLLQYLITAVKP